MSEPEPPRYGRASLNGNQREVLDRFLSGNGHAILEGPVGTGKSRVAAEIATAVATRPGRVLIVASSPLAQQMAASARQAGVPTLELSRAKLRQLLDEDWQPPRASVVHVNRLLVSDPWSADLLAKIGWDLVIFDDPELDSRVLQAFLQQAGARGFAISNSPSVLYEPWRAEADVYVLESPFSLESDQPVPQVAARFEPVWFRRDADEIAIAAMVDDVIDVAGRSGFRLGLQQLATANASSSYALQARTLRQLERLREARNFVAHLGRTDAPKDAATALALNHGALLLEISARLESISSAIDELEADTKRDAFVQLALDEHGNASGGTVVFCSLAATADYVASGLAFLQQRVYRLSARRSDPDRLLWATTEPHHFIVAHDPALKGVDLRSARHAVNYDIVADPRRMHIRWSRLDWREPTTIRVSSLLPHGPMSALEERALARMPYLTGADTSPAY